MKSFMDYRTEPNARARSGDTELLPWPQMDQCSTRAALDEAVAQVLGLDAAKIADWPQRIVREPAVSNKRL